MAISVNWATGVISVLKVDLTLVQSVPTVIYDHSMDDFWRDLRALEDSAEGRAFPRICDYNQPASVGGVQLAAVLLITDYYTITYEDDQYAVNQIGLNTNAADKVNVNQVSIRSSNSAGLVTSAAIEFGEYGDGVTIDSTLTTERTNYPYGTNREPVGNVPDAAFIANFRGFTQLFVVKDLTLTAGDDVRGYHMIGKTHINTVIVIEPEALCLKTRFSAFDITGTLDGDSEIKDCVVRSLIYFNGHIHDSYLIGTIFLSGSLQANISNCKILDVLNPPTINCGGTGQNLMMPNYSGRLIIDNLTGTSQVAIGLDAGEVIINPTCISGTIAISGNGRVIDNSGSGCYVIDTTTDGSEVHNIQQTIEMLRPHHTGTGKIIFWNPYGGNDSYSGDHENRATKTFLQAHTLASDNGHDIIICISGDPSGTTVTTENCVITKNYVFVRGAGRDFTVHSNNDTLPAFDIQANGVELSSIQATTNTTNINAAIKSSGVFPLLKDLYIADSANGILVTGGEFGIIDNCRVSHGNGYGVRIEGASEHFNIKNSHIGSNIDDGLQIGTTSGHEVHISDTIIHGNGGYGMDIESGVSVTLIENNVSLFSNTLGAVRDLGTGTHDSSNGKGIANSVWEEQTNNHTVEGTTGSELWHLKHTKHEVFIDTELVLVGEGSQHSPFNSLTTAIDFSEAHGLRDLTLYSDITVDRQLKNFEVSGVGVPTVDINNQIMDGSVFQRCALTGIQQGTMQANECAIVNLSGMQGVFLTVSAAGTLTPATGGSLLISRVAPALAAQPWTLNMNSGLPSVVAVHNSSGGVIITNMDHIGDILHFHASQGVITIDDTCAAGNIVISGNVKIVGSGTGVVIDKSAVSNEIFHDTIT